MKRRRGHKISLYWKLVWSYVLFSILIVVLVFGSMLVVSMVVTQGNFSNSRLYAITTEATCQEGLPGILGMDGWVEQLDGQYRVVEVYGEKQTEAMAYEPRALFALTKSGGEATGTYIGFLNERQDGPGYYLVMHHRGNVALNPTLVYSTDNSDPSWNRLLTTLFLGLFTGTCLLMGRYLSRRIRKPLRSLSDAMHRVKVGEKAVLLTFQAEAEFAEIRDAFNIMTQSLADTEREKAELEARRDKMLLALSHDIKTPIATINSFALALEQGLVAEEALPGYYRMIHTKAQRVAALTDDLFAMLKMKHRDYPLVKKQEDFCEFLRRLCAEYYQDVQEKGHSLEVEIPEEAVMYEGDYGLLARAVGNLLSNGVKYNETGEMLEVRLQVEGERLILCVMDDGDALPPGLQGRLFDEFARGDSARRSDGGTGLGLSIAKAICERHGGDIQYARTAGRNCFTMSLPRNVEEQSRNRF